VPLACGTNDFAVDNRRLRVDQVRIIRDLAKAFRPIIAASRKKPECLVHDVKLNALAVELDFMNPLFVVPHQAAYASIKAPFPGFVKTALATSIGEVLARR
jgi:hypothetical protein